MPGGKVALCRAVIDASPEQIFEKLADLQQWENVQSGRSVVKGPKGTVLQQHDEFTYHSRFAPGPIGAKVSEVEGAKTLSWDDRALAGLIHGEHRWLLSRRGGRKLKLPFLGSSSKTQVTLGHEVSGPLSFIVSGDALEKHGSQWLQDLKTAFEK